MKRGVLGGFVVVVCAGAPLVTAQTIQVSKDNRTIAVSVTDTASVLADVAVGHVGCEA